MASVYEMVTARIIEQLEQGIIPWHKPWTGTAGAWSRSTGRPYSLLNQWLMPAGEYATFNQIKKEGGKVKKGAHGYPLTFFKSTPIKETRENGEEVIKNVPILRYYTVFNIETQTEGLELKHPRTKEERALEPVEALEAIKDDYLNREGVKFFNELQDRAFYNPTGDYIKLPMMEQFDSEGEYYSTAFHEIAHSTGHHSRLNRIKETANFGSNDYGKEELVAEITAAAILNDAGMETAGTLKNSAAYIQNWTNAIKGDSKLIVHASSKAQKAYDLIMNIQGEK